MREIAKRAEEAGFAFLMAPDHLIFRRSPAGNVPAIDMPEGKSRGIWEVWSVLSAVAEATRRVHLGTLVACTGFRNPALLAKMADTLDEISGGRLILGLGAGWHEPEYDAFGYPFDHRVARFEEALQIIIPACCATATSTSRAGTTRRATASSGRAGRARTGRRS